MALGKQPDIVYVMINTSYAKVCVNYIFMLF